MTGPEHYREAERLIAQAMNALTTDDTRIKGEGRQMAYSMLVARAQAHATLALAAATADCMTTLHRGWDEVLDR